jgi:hypothetical protein
MVSSADELIKMNPLPDTQISFLSFGPAGCVARHMGDRFAAAEMVWFSLSPDDVCMLTASFSDARCCS